MNFFRIVFLLFFASQNLSAQVLLDADGAGNTYELITSKLAPGKDPIEVPDCGHDSFGRHIDEIYDDELGINVFRFFIHTHDDDDRCQTFDRQRNEIKAYDKSPDNLLGIEGEIHEYKWKFKLDAGFQPSAKFTHIHQLKAVGGTESSMPLITLTTRDGNPDDLELRYAETTSQVTLKETNLTPFKGVWCEVTETVEYGESGTYDLIIKRVSDNSTLFNYSNSDIRMWKTQADFIRPKWGIYRSLQDSTKLRDEEVLFANFSILETTSSSTVDVEKEENDIQLSPNPANDFIKILGIDEEHSFQIFNLAGGKVSEGKTTQFKIDISNLPKAVYLIQLKIGKEEFVEKIIKK